MHFLSSKKERKKMEIEKTMVNVSIVVSVIVGGVIGFLAYLYCFLYDKPTSLRSRLQKQGIKGPSPCNFLLGNSPQIKSIQQNTIQLHLQISHDWPSTIIPHLLRWRHQYGPTFMYSTGNILLVCTTEIQLVKEINLCTSFTLGKPSHLSRHFGPLLGLSILTTSGLIWSHQRKIIGPQFYMDKVKSMVGLMINSTASILTSWHSRIESDGGTAQIDVCPDIVSLSADIISRGCFGSDYTQGENIFSSLRNLQNVLSKVSVGIPGLRYMPTKNNREVWKLEKDINSMILRVVMERAAANDEKDLLQMLLEGAKTCAHYQGSANKFIVDNCKAIYFAGHETTAITTSWALMLLAAHPEWQSRARAEVLQVCKGHLPDAPMLQNMKILTMVIQETLHLYPRSIFVIREAFQDVKFKDITVPKGAIIQIPVGILHHNPDLWGPDADQFNPDRFANGIIGASKSSLAYMPFGIGARTCIGQYFAITELKVILSVILSNFSLSLSPAYHHSSVFRLVVQPGNGVKLYVRRFS